MYPAEKTRPAKPHTRSTRRKSPLANRAPMIGPRPDPTPRAPSRNPRPASPDENASAAYTASWLTTPAPIANVIFEHNSAKIVVSRRASWMASRMSATGRTGARCVPRSSCIGRFTIAISAAATTKVAMSAMNAAVRPNASANTPPNPAPTASMTPQLEPKSAFARRNSSGERARLGTAASTAGRTNAARAAMSPCATNAIHTVPSSTKSRPHAAIACAIDTITSTVRRS